MPSLTSMYNILVSNPVVFTERRVNVVKFMVLVVIWVGPWSLGRDFVKEPLCVQCQKVSMTQKIQSCFQRQYP